MTWSIGDSPIRALVPRGRGHQFVQYADSCSGVPDRVEASRHQQVTDVLRRLTPAPEFISFPGDAVMDGGERAQWDHWIDQEVAWARQRDIPILQATSNHNTYDDNSTDVYRSVWPNLPQNGPDGQQGLAYYLRFEDLLYISLHQPDPAWEMGNGMQRGVADAEAAWLTSVIDAHRDVEHIVVAGHYPVFPVNGYREAPQWCFTRGAGAQLWELLRKNGVTAYLCSHVIAFDVQSHDGILHITSGGAGTAYGPGGAMPGPPEYLHAVQMALDRQGLRYHVLDVHGRIRESLSWPFPEPSADWRTGAVETPGTLTPDRMLVLKADETGHGREMAEGAMRPGPYRDYIAWLVSEDGRFRFGIDCAVDRFTLELELDGVGRQRWVGPTADCGTQISIELALHPGMGPGGMLYRHNGNSRWSSMESSSASGLESYSWPTRVATPSSLIQVQHQVIPLDRPA
ncbi:metallophosphoesterase family protein [Streptomyces scopuliridis]|uniref:metallophosphoesterase family protein n=1 Tax=Streptomyces scopuliridis TaxID=452529 RepID=UPI0036986795